MVAAAVSAVGAREQESSLPHVVLEDVRVEGQKIENIGLPYTGCVNLAAQRAWQFELGHREASADKRYVWDVTVKDRDMQTEILESDNRAPSNMPKMPTGRVTGVGKSGDAMVVTKGLLAKGSSTKDDSLQTRVAYTWSRFKFTDDVRGGGVGGPNVLIAKDGNTVPGSPEHNQNVGVRLC